MNCGIWSACKTCEFSPRLVSSQPAGRRRIRPRRTQSTTLTAPPRPSTAASPIMAAAQMDALQPGAPKVWAARRPQLPLLSSHPAFRPGIQFQPVITLWLRSHMESVLEPLFVCRFYGCFTTLTRDSLSLCMTTLL